MSIQMKNWATVGKRTILDHSEFLTVEEHQVALPDGRRIDDWPWVITPDYVNIVAVTEKAEFVCIRQTKYAVGDTMLSTAAGYLDPGEEPLAAAKRELLEETGYSGGRWRKLGSFAVDGNRGVCTASFFLAEGVAPVADPDSDDLEEQELLLLSRGEVELAIADNAFKVLGPASAIAMALLTLDRP